MPKPSTTPTTDWQLVCGMEIHAELATQSKMFCACVNDPFNASEPNSYTCPVCLGMPGGLPVANKTAIEWVIKLGLALGCEISLFSKFDRKHYFYPDLAKGYQISQYDIPFCRNGVVETSYGPVRIHRIHLEEDTGKLLHTTVAGRKVSLVDFNRCGVPLVEIVSEADIHSPEQAKEYAKNIRRVLRYLGFANCDMEQGGMRLEANISLRTPAQTVADELPNYKVEVKNINSFRFLEQAISWEIQRQSLQLTDGETPRQETRGWNSQTNTTFPQRTKEDAEDYRYFPDPDLPPIRFTAEQIAAFKAELPVLPNQRLAEWSKRFQLEARYGEWFTETLAEADWAEQLFTAAQAQQLDVNKLAAALVNKKIGPFTSADRPATVLAALTALTQKDEVAEADIASAVDAVVAEQAEAVIRYRAGQTQLLNFFVGQTMRKLAKKVDVGRVNEYLKAKLAS